jgi:hypothetical protein
MGPAWRTRTALAGAERLRVFGEVAVPQNGVCLRAALEAPGWGMRPFSTVTSSLLGPRLDPSTDAARLPEQAPRSILRRCEPTATMCEAARDRLSFFSNG